MLIGVKFEGGLAEQHRIPAYDGTKSLEGISRSIIMISNYLVEGKIRRRDFNRVPINFHMVAHRPGSFETLYDIAYGAAVYGGPIFAAGAAGAYKDLLKDLIKSVTRRVIGIEKKSEIPKSVDALERERGGDIAALVEAAEPSMRTAHSVINYGVMNININQPQQDSSEELAHLNPETKKFVWENVINNEMRVKLFSIGSFNANQGTGRAFDQEEGRSVPFELAKDADWTSVGAILSSISSYTRKKRLGDNLKSVVAIKYTSVDALDGRIKKIRIHKARNEIEEL